MYKRRPKDRRQAPKVPGDYPVTGQFTMKEESITGEYQPAHRDQPKHRSKAFCHNYC
jgi:hypothetical protein